MTRLSPTRRLQAAAVAAAAIAAGTLVAAAPAAQAARPGAHCTTPKLAAGWYGDNQARLQQLIDQYGSCNPYRPSREKPVAVFDWDNTVVKNDVGDATMFWLLRNGKIRQPAGGDWTTTSRYLTPAAAQALATACGPLARPGAPLPTGTPAGAPCADELNAVYGTAATRTGAAAFAGWDHRTIEPAYAWLPQLTQGWTASEVRGFAAAARTENLAAPVGTKQQVGTTTTATGWVRYYDQQRDLIKGLQKAGFDVWISSASPQPVVEVWAQGVGVKADHVIGIRNTTRNGRLTAHLQGCGSVKDGADTMITYIDGKRCWINKEVFGVRGPAAEKVQPASRRQVFAAGDSDTDISFLRDATALRLVVNRNKNELMCRAYDNSDGKWIVNPMFIEPKKQKTSPYPCSTTGYTDHDGTAGPVRRGDTSVIPDQTDSVFSN
ncbi:putative conserved lipoprotein LppF [Streptomyces lavendulae subsp. lavendulae]|uniref:haloacid dehalogenase-like hydrolase n=1 Tax=Streptomyces lavendulae TaxID=1914 RepID=UPI0024A44CFD|nr:haloacid dehalogenase-like hydrolase [Streptomyces lavendulae]GLV84042.1 putative conserved lipoprotein LppF [Streptomyces lavendulae subsp. lavendulae]